MDLAGVFFKVLALVFAPALLFAADLAYLQAFYRRINEEGTSLIQLACPECQAKFEVDLASLGGS